jgi:hypothetical protein
MDSAGGDCADVALFTWLERRSGQHWDAQRTIIVAQYRNGDPLPLDYLSADHRIITTTPTRGEQVFHGHPDQSVAYLPNPS